MGAAEKMTAPMPFWPEGMGWDMALSYTQVGEEQLRRWQKRGLVRFRPSGPRGALLTTRGQLDEALRQLFTGGPDVGENMEF